MTLLTVLLISPLMIGAEKTLACLDPACRHQVESLNLEQNPTSGEGWEQLRVSGTSLGTGMWAHGLGSGSGPVSVTRIRQSQAGPSSGLQVLQLLTGVRQHFYWPVQSGRWLNKIFVWQSCDLTVALNWLSCFLHCIMKTIYLKPHISCLSFMLSACLVGWVCVLLLWLSFFTEQSSELFAWTFIVFFSSSSSASLVWGSSSEWGSTA